MNKSGTERIFFWSGGATRPRWQHRATFGNPAAILSLPRSLRSELSHTVSRGWQPCALRFASTFPHLSGTTTKRCTLRVSQLNMLIVFAKVLRSGGHRNAKMVHLLTYFVLTNWALQLQNNNNPALRSAVSPRNPSQIWSSISCFRDGIRQPRFDFFLIFFRQLVGYISVFSAHFFYLVAVLA